MFDAIAARYDVVNDVGSLGHDRLWRRAVTHAVEKACGGLSGRMVLDVACGTGASSRALADRGAFVVGCDTSEGMLEVAQRREDHRGAAVRDESADGGAPPAVSGAPVVYLKADAERLPFPSASFDAVCVSYGLRNMDDPVAALRQMRRVARPGAPIAVLDFDMPSNRAWRLLYRGYASVVLPALGRIASDNADAYRYLNDSIASWPGRAGVARMLRDAGWDDIRTATLTGGVAFICVAVA